MGQRLNDFINACGRILENILTWKGGLKKFIEWNERRDFKIERIEGSNFREAGFSFWLTSRNTVCAKMEISDQSGARQGLYLMLITWQDSNFAHSRFVPLAEIKFNYPYRIVDGRLQSFDTFKNDETKILEKKL